MLDKENLALDVTISLEAYATLMNDSKALQALQNAGVDNWEGYEAAMEEASKDMRIHP